MNNVSERERQCRLQEVDGKKQKADEVKKGAGH